MAKEQIEQWAGDFGRAYTTRNLYTPAQLDAFYERQYGLTRTQMNTACLASVPRDARILEVGCNVGNQLWSLKEMGFSDLYGIEINAEAVEQAKQRTRGIHIIKGSAFDLPFKEGYFDLVFTSGVLIHIPPAELPAVMGEIRRCTRSFIWGMEYYATQHQEIPYRGQQALLWKGDFLTLYQRACPDLEVVREQRYPYLEGGNVDSMFLLRVVPAA
jgi:pseudaminic acid biosynthesis-associated methylase